MENKLTSNLFSKYCNHTTLGKTTEIAIGIPHEIADEIDKLLKTEEIKIFEITSRRQFTIAAIKKFTEYMKNPSEYIKKEQIKDVKRLQKELKQKTQEINEIKDKFVTELAVKKRDKIFAQRQEEMMKDVQKQINKTEKELKEKLSELDRIKESRLDDEAKQYRSEKYAIEQQRQIRLLQDTVNELKKETGWVEKKPIEFCCVSCGTVHVETSCPACNSKLKRTSEELKDASIQRHDDILKEQQRQLTETQKIVKELTKQLKEKTVTHYQDESFAKNQQKEMNKLKEEMDDRVEKKIIDILTRNVTNEEEKQILKKLKK